jgi:hypothetical protein
LHGHQERYDGALPTMFPEPLMLAATFDPQLAYEVGLPFGHGICQSGDCCAIAESVAVVFHMINSASVMLMENRGDASSRFWQRAMANCSELPHQLA